MKNLRTHRPAPRNRGLTTSLMLLTVVLSFAPAGCQKQAVAPPPPPTVMVAELVTTNVPMHTEIIGQLDSPQNVEIRARVEGFVDKILFTEGTTVAADAPLFRLDDKPFQQRLAGAKGALAEAEAALSKYRADTNRLGPLALKKAIPQQDMDNAVASVEIGLAGVLTAQARVESAQIDLHYCDVRAPISGLIGAKQVSVGELVGKGSPTLMATISTLNPIWFYCSVSEVDYLKAEAKVRTTGRKIAELPVTLLLADGTTHPAGGRFVFIDRAVDVKTGTLRVRAEFPNAQELLRPGMFARIRVDLGTRAESIMLPERAVSELQGKTFVWVIGADNKASQRSVKLGETIGGSVLVVEGLKAGERVVIEGLQKVREGAPVQPMTAAQMAQSAAAAKPAEAKPAKE